MITNGPIHAALLGHAVGDALGVPVEFGSRDHLAGHNRVIDMQAYGTHGQPAGTWSDDASLTFCLAEMLCDDYDLQALAQRFIAWKERSYWTPHGSVFDMGITTRAAIGRLMRGVAPTDAGGKHEDENGNGALMRILPLLFHVRSLSLAERFVRTEEVASLTHRHIRSTTACFIYLEIARQVLEGDTLKAALEAVRSALPEYRAALPQIPEVEWMRFHRIFPAMAHRLAAAPIENCAEEEISSSGYVVHTLEASLWCLLTTDSYEAAVLKAVNLGSDTDTTGAVCGGLAGLVYGMDSIPLRWIEKLARMKDILELADRLAGRYP